MILIRFLALVFQVLHAMGVHVWEPKVQTMNRLLGDRMFFPLLVVFLSRYFWEERAPFLSLLLMALVVKIVT